jgi:hypothetical protein
MDTWAGFLSIGDDEQPIEGFLREFLEQIPRLEADVDVRDVQESIERLRISLGRGGADLRGESRLRFLALPLGTRWNRGQSARCTNGA